MILMLGGLFCFTWCFIPFFYHFSGQLNLHSLCKSELYYFTVIFIYKIFYYFSVIFINKGEQNPISIISLFSLLPFLFLLSVSLSLSFSFLKFFFVAGMARSPGGFLVLVLILTVSIHRAFSILDSHQLVALELFSSADGSFGRLHELQLSLLLLLF